MKIPLMLRKFIRSKIWLLFFLVACGRGCSCTTVVDTEKETRKIDGVKVKITAEKLKTTTSYVLRNKPKSYSYAFEMKVKLPDRPMLEHLCHIPTGSAGDIDEVIENFQLHFSPDKKHFAIGYNTEVFNVYHLLEKGMPFTSHHYQEYNENHISFSELNWLAYPEPKEIAKQLIEGAYGNLEQHERDQIEKALRDQPIPCEFDFYLIDQFPDHLATKVFSKARVNSLVKYSDDWKERAREKVLPLLSDGVSRSESINMVKYMDDPATLQAADGLILAKWPDGQSLNIPENNYLHFRLDEANPPIRSKLLDSLIQVASEKIMLESYQEEVFEGEYREKKPDGTQVQHAFELLLKVNRKERFEAAFQIIFESDFYDRNSSNIDRIAIDQYKNLSSEAQQVILAGYQYVFPSINTISKKRVLRFLKRKIPKEQYAKLEEIERKGQHSQILEQ